MVTVNIIVIIASCNGNEPLQEPMVTLDRISRRITSYKYLPHHRGLDTEHLVIECESIETFKILG